MVSVIITTKNESGHIEACLKSIKRQTDQDIEIIVVDNRSHDKTKEIAKRYTKRVFDAGPERSAQRNVGADRAKGDYLLFLDADMELTPTVAEECVKVMEQKTINNKQKELQDSKQKTVNNKQSYRSLLIDHCPKFLAVVIPEKSFGIGFWAKCKAMERSFYLGVPWIESARFFQKKAFVAIGGYDETLTGPEDFELPQRFKMVYGDDRTGRISASIRHNEGKLSLEKTLQKKYLYGKKMWEYRKKQGSRSYFGKQANIWLRYGLFLKKPGIILNHPIVFIGMVLLKTLEIGAVLLGALSVV